MIIKAKYKFKIKEIFQPILIRKILKLKLANNIKEAKLIMNQNEKLKELILVKITKNTCKK
jgi:hypothetical protein